MESEIFSVQKSRAISVRSNFSSEKDDCTKLSARKSRRSKLKSMLCFDGSDVNGWLLHAEDCFEHYDVLESDKVHLSYFYMHGPALVWYRWMQRSRLLSDWLTFVDIVRLRFGSSKYGDSIGALSQLTHTGDVKQYIDEFEALTIGINAFSGPMLVNMFVSGLRSNIRWKILSIKPITVHLAMALALLYEVLNYEMDTFENSWVKNQYDGSVLMAESVTDDHLATVLEAKTNGKESKEVSRDNVGDKVEDKFACFESFVAPNLIVSEVENDAEKSQVEFLKLGGKKENFVSNEAILAESFESVASEISDMDVHSDPNQFPDAVFFDFRKESIKCTAEVEESSSRKELSESDDEKGIQKSIIGVDASMSG